MFRFSIRELVLVTLIVALVCGWWLHHQRATARQLAMEIELAAEKAEKERMLKFSKEITAEVQQWRGKYSKSYQGGSALGPALGPAGP